MYNCRLELDVKADSEVKTEISNKIVKLLPLSIIFIGIDTSWCSGAEYKCTIMDVTGLPHQIVIVMLAALSFLKLLPPALPKHT